MYKNIGKKIKGFSIVFAWIIIAVSCLFGFYRLYTEEIDYKNIVITALIIIGGTLISVVISWFMYAFGVITEKAENSDKILENLEEIRYNSQSGFKTENYSQSFESREDTEKSIPLESFKLPETRDELFESQLRKLKKDYEMSRITFDEYEEGKLRLEKKYK